MCSAFENEVHVPKIKICKIKKCLSFHSDLNLNDLVEFRTSSHLYEKHELRLVLSFQENEF